MARSCMAALGGAAVLVALSWPPVVMVGSVLVARSCTEAGGPVLVARSCMAGAVFAVVAAVCLQLGLVLVAGAQHALAGTALEAPEAAHAAAGDGETEAAADHDAATGLELAPWAVSGSASLAAGPSDCERLAG